MARELTYAFGKVTIHDNYLVAVMNEGITVTPDLNEVLLTIAKTYYKDKRFVYITHRVNSYAVDPNIYFKTSEIPNLIGFAVVSGKKTVIDNIDLERSFLSKPFKSFTRIEDAVDWAHKINKS